MALLVAKHLILKCSNLLRLITVKQHSNSIQLTIDADIINTSSLNVDLYVLKNVIIKQIQHVFNGNVGNYIITPIVNITVLKHVWQCKSDKLVLQIVNDIKHNNPAEADFKGLCIKLNKSVIESIIIGENARIIPHEIGHILGLEHPHAPALFDSVNTRAHILEQAITAEERKVNLMSQTWYAQKASVPINEAIKLTKQQIEIIINNFNTNLLNKNRHLRYFLWWKKIL